MSQIHIRLNETVSATSCSAAIRVGDGKAPRPSAALLSLQKQGFELPDGHQPSNSMSAVESLASAFDPRATLRSQVLERSTTPTQLDRNTSVHSSLSKSQSTNESRSSSLDTTVTNIIHLYTNISKQSLRSEYEEIVSSPDSLEDRGIPIVGMHPPKVYRNAVASLLEDQFNDHDLSAVPVPSPLVIASSSNHKAVGIVSMSLALSPPVSPEMYAVAQPCINASQNSIQITPEISPIVLPIDKVSVSQSYVRSLNNRGINLEVPDVREADDWYHGLLSPISPESEASLRRSYQTQVLRMSHVQHRDAAYNALSPRLLRESPRLQPISSTEYVLPTSVSLLPAGTDLVSDHKTSHLLESVGPETPDETVRSLYRSSHLTAFLNRESRAAHESQRSSPAISMFPDQTNDGTDGGRDVSSKDVRGSSYRQTYTDDSRATGSQDSDLRDSKQAKSRFSGSRDATGYNDGIFEASGGDKKKGFVRRMFRSAEDKRKDKLKGSIVIIDSRRMDPANGGRQSSTVV